MEPAAGIEVRLARRADQRRVTDFLAQETQGPPGASSLESLLSARMENLTLAFQGDAVIGACQFLAGRGHCSAVLAPQMLQWEVGLASQLIRTAAAVSHRRDGSKLIQSLTAPDDSGPLVQALRLAGFEELAVLSYMRRDVRPEERDLPLPPELQWQHYRRLRHGKFVRTIGLTYEQGLDCPKLTGLRTVDEAVTTHKHTGLFCPRSWQMALREGRPAGVSLVNNLRGRGELIYLGVVPEARRRGIGRALVVEAIRQTAAMGLPQMGVAVDVANTPAFHLYESMGFREMGRRTAHFVPAAGLESLVI
jgi:GNAT superfamily N-acetyltransferase